MRAEVGENGEVVVRQLISILRGRGSAWGRVQAGKELLDRGWGKAPQTVHVDVTESSTVDVLKHATEEELAMLEALNRRAFAESGRP